MKYSVYCCKHFPKAYTHAANNRQFQHNNKDMPNVYKFMIYLRLLTQVLSE